MTQTIFHKFELIFAFIVDNLLLKFLTAFLSLSLLVLFEQQKRKLRSVKKGTKNYQIRGNLSLHINNVITGIAFNFTHKLNEVPLIISNVLKPKSL